MATPFERRPIAVETTLAERYYCKSYDLTVDPGTVTSTGVMRAISSGANWSISVTFPERLRAAPTVTAYSPTSGASGKAAKDIGGDVTPTLVYTSSHTVNFFYGSAVDATYFVHFTADAEL